MEPATILLVDDNPQILGIMAEVLRPLGHLIATAHSGTAALDRALAAPPDVILLDVMMPDMDGFTVTRAIRAHPLLAQIPVILVTALDDRHSRLRGFDAGADEFVSKPFDYVELRARVSTILRLNRYRRLVEEQSRVAVERARFVWAVDQSADGVLILGPDDRPVYANPQARVMLGLAPNAALDEPFLALATRGYTLTPLDSWAAWPAAAPGQPARFLVRPQSRAHAERWLQVELLPPADSDPARLLSLRDVTAQITSQREMWTFQAMIGHKLRTPLVGILGGLNILAGNAATIDRTSVTRIAEVALDSARRLRSEVEDLLAYLRPPADPYGVDGPSVSEFVLLAEQIAADHGLATLGVEQEAALAARRIALGRQSVEVLLRELIENAVKFHPQRSPAVRLALAADGPATLAVALADDGPGLADDTLERAWHPYYQGERSFTGQVEGMGLGLPLVARIVHAVGGDYALSNRPEGGAVVTLSLPLAAPPAPGAPPAKRV